MTDSLNVAVIHYHLRGGGVTRVIQHAIHALAGAGGRAVVLTGESPDTDTGLDVRVVEGLGYATRGAKHDQRARLRELHEAARDGLGHEPDLWHIHNHCLGKNALTPVLVRALAGQGARVLLQIHDFAEDGRPENYRLLRDALSGPDAESLGNILYPQAGNVHYCLLNARDHGFLARAGVQASQLHLLPNAVCVDAAGEGRADADCRSGGSSAGSERLYLYPTRAIRRKNLGELVLWSCLAGDGDGFATTLAPKNPGAVPVHDAWVKFARELGLPVEFAIGEKSSLGFAGLLARAHACVTTSVAEGFGLAFLEPWLAGKPLAGRKLPEITCEFEDAGVDLSGLYARLTVPLAWVGEVELRARIRDALVRSRSAYALDTGEAEIEAAFAAAAGQGRVDFGRLDEELQMRVVRRVAADRELGGDLAPSGLGAPEGKVVRQNQRVIRAQYSLEQYAERLLGIYGQVVAAGTNELPAVDADRLLSLFAAPERFCLLRT